MEKWKGGKVEKWKGGIVEKIKSYRELELWKVSMDFVVRLYKETSRFPKSELYGLTAQIRRAAVSIPSNIAEGSGRRNTKEFIQFLYIANGSLSEIETQLEISRRLDYIKDLTELLSTIKHLRKLLGGLIQALKKKVE